MKKRCIGHIPVDAGMVMLVDPCYVIGEDRTQSWSEFLKDVPEHLTTCEVKHPVTGVPVGLLVHSGHGDGLYPVTADITKDGIVRSVTITFI